MEIGFLRRRVRELLSEGGLGATGKRLYTTRRKLAQKRSVMGVGTRIVGKLGITYGAHLA
jgi:hypothetical protein